MGGDRGHLRRGTLENSITDLVAIGPVRRRADGVVGACFVDQLDKRFASLRRARGGFFFGLKQIFTCPVVVDSRLSECFSDDSGLFEFDAEAEVD